MWRKKACEILLTILVDNSIWNENMCANNKLDSGYDVVEANASPCDTAVNVTCAIDVARLSNDWPDYCVVHLADRCYYICPWRHMPYFGFVSIDIVVIHVLSLIVGKHNLQWTQVWHEEYRHTTRDHRLIDFIIIQINQDDAWLCLTNGEYP